MASIYRDCSRALQYNGTESFPCCDFSYKEVLRDINDSTLSQTPTRAALFKFMASELEGTAVSACAPRTSVCLEGCSITGVCLTCKHLCALSVCAHCSFVGGTSTICFLFHACFLLFSSCYGGWIVEEFIKGKHCNVVNTYRFVHRQWHTAS